MQNKEYAGLLEVGKTSAFIKLIENAALIEKVQGTASRERYLRNGFSAIRKAQTLKDLEMMDLWKEVPADDKRNDSKDLNADG
jgi:hypothetical protein